MSTILKELEASRPGARAGGSERRIREREPGISGQLKGHRAKIESEFVLRLAGENTAATVDGTAHSAQIERTGAANTASRASKKSPTPAELARFSRNPNRALAAIDSETQTLGCRHSDCGMCKSYMIADCCAFSRADGICSNPPRTWRKRYNRLARRRPQTQTSSSVKGRNV